MAADSAVAVDVTHADGAKDLIVVTDPANDGALMQKDWGVTCAGELCLVRRDACGCVRQ